MRNFCKMIILVLQIGAFTACEGWAASTEESPTSVGAQKTNEEQLKPTIYYIKMLNLNKKCSSKKTIYNELGKAIVQVCPTQYKLCVIEGTCALSKDASPEEEFVTVNPIEESEHASVPLINYYKTQNGRHLFVKVNQNRCPFGYGARGLCLDPFYTIAADLTIHKLGDVIFVPSVKGLKLPNGEVHDGHFIVRDKGGAIKGRNRFDFFTSYFTSRNLSNPLLALNLGNPNARVKFQWVRGALAESVRESRRYPLTPYSK